MKKKALLGLLVALAASVSGFPAELIIAAPSERVWVNEEWGVKARVVSSNYAQLDLVSLAYKNSAVNFYKEDLKGLCFPDLSDASLLWQYFKGEEIVTLLIDFKEYRPEGCPTTVAFRRNKKKPGYGPISVKQLRINITSTGKITAGTDYFAEGDKACSVDLYPKRKDTCSKREDVKGFVITDSPYAGDTKPETSQPGSKKANSDDLGKIIMICE